MQRPTQKDNSQKDNKMGTVTVQAEDSGAYGDVRNGLLVNDTGVLIQQARDILKARVL